MDSESNSVRVSVSPWEKVVFRRLRKDYSPLKRTLAIRPELYFWAILCLERNSSGYNSVLSEQLVFLESGG
jgi:hypothetical protein